MKLIEVAYFTNDVAEMTEFYGALLGVDPVIKYDGMAIFMAGDTKIFIHRTYESTEGELPPENHIAYQVKDVDETCNSLTEQGLKLVFPPKDYYWGRAAYLRDPDGHLIEITT